MVKRVRGNFTNKLFRRTKGETLIRSKLLPVLIELLYAGPGLLKKGRHRQHIAQPKLIKVKSATFNCCFLGGGGATTMRVAVGPAERTDSKCC